MMFCCSVELFPPEKERSKDHGYGKICADHREPFRDSWVVYRHVTALCQFFYADMRWIGYGHNVTDDITSIAQDVPRLLMYHSGYAIEHEEQDQKHRGAGRKRVSVALEERTDEELRARSPLPGRSRRTAGRGQTLMG